MASDKDVPSHEHFAEALSLLKEVPLVDAHNDWACLIRGRSGNKLDARFEPDKSLPGHTDVKRLVAGKVGAVFWSVYVDCPDVKYPDLKNDWSDKTHYLPMHETLQQIDLVHRLIDLYPQTLELAQNAGDILRIHREGKIASLLGAEGLHQIGNSASVLRNYHRLGVRYVTLAHNSNNPYADCAIAEPSHGGLSEAGRKMILEMNRIGMMVDLSHTSVEVMLQTLALSKAPVAFTHSNCFALCKHPRNVPDNVLTLLKQNNGIIMVTFVDKFVHEDPKEAGMEHVVDHIMHAASMIGFDHIGIGSDYDGTLRLAKGLEDTSCFPALVDCMLKRGIPKGDIKKILGLNLVRVLKEVEDYARSSTLQVLEDEVELWVT